MQDRLKLLSPGRFVKDQLPHYLSVQGAIRQQCLLSKQLHNLPQGCGPRCNRITGKLIRVIAIHPMPPISSADKVARDALLVRVTQKDSEPTLIVGDFNASPWALGMRDLNRTGFKRASGMMPTQSLFGGLPIDHILASESHWRTAQAGVAGSFGSDHSVVWGKLTLAP